MNEFVTPAAAERERAKARRLTLAFRCLSGGTLALFVTLCVLIGTGAVRVPFPVLAVSMTLLGWVCIALYTLFLRPARGNAAHLERLLAGEKGRYEGCFHLSEQSFQIPGSARVRKVTLTPADEKAEPAVLPGDDADASVRLNLDEAWIHLAPPEGALARVQTSGRFITGIEALEGGAPQVPRKRSAWRAFRRGFSVLFPAFVLWAMMVIVLGGFVYNQITDTAPKNKIVLYADLKDFSGADALAVELEKAKPDAIRMVQVHPFSYALFGSDALRGADLFIVPASHVEEYREWFAPLPEAFIPREGGTARPSGSPAAETDDAVPASAGTGASSAESFAAEEGTILMKDGVPFGLLLYDPATDDCVAGSWIPYPEEPCYLFFGAASPHLEDQASVPIVRALLRLK